MQKISSVFLFFVLILGISQTPFLPNSNQQTTTLTGYNIQAHSGIAFADSEKEGDKDQQDSEDIKNEGTDTNDTDTNETDTNDTDTNDTDTNETDTNETDTNETDTNETDTNETDTNDTDNEDTKNKDTKDHEVENEMKNNKENMTNNEKHATQKAEEKISELQQRIDKLEQRVQSLLAMLESGKYFGPTFGGDKTPTSYDLSFDGTATSINGSAKASVSGEVFFESLVTGDRVSKFRVTGGDVQIGSANYDLIFGKARVTAGETNSMVLIAQAVDDEGNAHTLKMLLDSTPLYQLGSESVDVSLKTPQSKIAGQWFLDADGLLSKIA